MILEPRHEKSSENAFFFARNDLGGGNNLWKIMIFVEMMMGGNNDFFVFCAFSIEKCSYIKRF